MKAVHLLDSMLLNCNQQEIDNLFLLQTVLKEEKQLLDMVHDGKSYKDQGPNTFSYQMLENAKSKDDIKNLINTIDSTLFEKNQSHADMILFELDVIRQRKQALNETVKHESKEKLVDLMTLMDDGKVELFSDVVDINEALKRLGLTEQEYQDYLKYAGDKNKYSGII